MLLISSTIPRAERNIRSLNKSWFQTIATIAIVCLTFLAIDDSTAMPGKQRHHIHHTVHHNLSKSSVVKQNPFASQSTNIRSFEAARGISHIPRKYGRLYKHMLSRPLGANLPISEAATLIYTIRRHTSAQHPSYSTRIKLIRRFQSRGSEIVETALSYQGMPYLFGGSSDVTGYDCSSLVQTVYAQNDVRLPRTAKEQFEYAIPISESELIKGDLVFFKNTYTSGLSHVGIYIGQGQFLHAANRSKGVRIDELDKPYYVQHWAGAGRVPTDLIATLR